MQQALHADGLRTYDNLPVVTKQPPLYTTKLQNGKLVIHLHWSIKCNAKDGSGSHHFDTFLQCSHSILQKYLLLHSYNKTAVVLQLDTKEHVGTCLRSKSLEHAGIQTS